MTYFVVCLSGRIGSGKTSVSAALGSARRAVTASFGAYVRREAVARGLDAEQREVLQDLGAELIAENGHEWLCRQVVATANWNGDCDLVIDGVRHVEVLETIRRITYPVRTLLVYLALEAEAELGVRAELRGVSSGARADLEQHSTEIDVIRALPDLADVVVSAENSVEQIVDTINTFLDGQRSN